MDNDLGYQELQTLAKRLETRVNRFSLEADESQAEGMRSYLTAQENSIEQARFLVEESHNKLIVATQAAVRNADRRAVIDLLEAYGKYGIKES